MYTNGSDVTILWSHDKNDKEILLHSFAIIKNFFIHYSIAFQPFSSRGTSRKFLIIRRNLNAPYSAIYIIFMEPSKELAEPLRSAEPRLKNTALQYPPLNSYDHFGNYFLLKMIVNFHFFHF